MYRGNSWQKAIFFNLSGDAICDQLRLLVLEDVSQEEIALW